MLYNLEVVNGEMTPAFSSDVFIYDVKVSDEVLSLMLNYDAPLDSDVTIYGNSYLTSGNNHVLVEVYDGKVTTYTLNVYKEMETQDVFKEYTKSQTIKEEILSDVTKPLIGSICFLLIVALYCIIFRKRKT